jgi:hypothetical protein
MFKQVLCRGCRIIKLPLVQAGNRRMCGGCFLVSLVHELKTDPHPFQLLCGWEKTAEVRRNDRPFRRGDLLILSEWDGEKFTGRQVQREIANVLPLDNYGCPDKVLLSFYLDGKAVE